jgi:hypothetical protein
MPSELRHFVPEGGTSEGTSFVIAVTAYALKIFEQCQFHITQMSILYHLINGFATRCTKAPMGSISHRGLC